MPHVLRLRACCLLLGCALLLCSCERTPHEEALRANAAGIQAAIAERDSGDVMVHLGEGFLANDTLDRDAARRLLLGYFLRFPKIAVVLSGIEVQINPYDPARATLQASAALAGFQGLLPEQGRLYRLSSEWRLEDGDWLLYRLQWE